MEAKSPNRVLPRTALRAVGLALVVTAAMIGHPGSAVATGLLAPANTSPPVISGVPQPGQTLSCWHGSWDNLPLLYAYQWNRDAAPITGATTAAYNVAAGDVGTQLTCAVTASNLLGSATATSSPVTVTAGAGSQAPLAGPGGRGVPLPAASAVILAPSSKRCASRRRFRIRVRQVSGISFVSVAVFVNGKRVKVARGERITAPVDLRGLPPGRFRARIVVKTSDGRSLSRSRKYRTCSSRAGHRRKHRR